jgi:hypothetical protein
VDEFDRADVVAAVPEHPAERVVEGVDVAEAHAAPIVDDPSELEGHFGHEAEDAAAGGLREPNAVGVKLGERVYGKAFCAELGLDGLDELGAGRAEIRDADACPEDRE